MGNKYLNQVTVPAGKSGRYAVEHFVKPAGEKIETSSFRAAFLGGQKGKTVVYGAATTWRRLVYEGGVWMSDLPIEQDQHRQCLKGFKGRVLIGGLGLGLAVNILARRKSVTRITVVEISKDVVSLVAPHIRDPRGIVDVVREDLMSFVAKPDPGEYDYAFYDIWQSDGEGTFFETVCPLREATWRFMPDINVVCWNENVMRGQLYFSLTSRYMQAVMFKAIPLDKLATDTDDKWLAWSVPFFKAVKDGVINGDNLNECAGQYARLYGRQIFASAWRRLVAIAGIMPKKKEAL